MRIATLASGRAMTGRLWAEARALAGLAESYGRLAAHGQRERAAEAAADPTEPGRRAAIAFLREKLGLSTEGVETEVKRRAAVDGWDLSGE